MCIKELSCNSCVRFSPYWEHAYDTRPCGFLSTMTLPEYVDYICRLNGEPVPKPRKKLSVPVTVDGTDKGMRLVIVDPANAYQQICRRFKHFDKNCVFLDDTPLAECERTKQCPGFSRINIMLVKTSDCAAPKKAPPPLMKETPVSTTDMRSKMVAAGTAAEDRPATLKFGKRASEYSAPSSLNTRPTPPPLEQVPSPTSDYGDLPDLVDIKPSDVRPPPSKPEKNNNKKMNEETPLPELESLTRDIRDAPPELELMTPVHVHAATVDRVAAESDSMDIGCAQKFCSYMDKYRRCCDTSFPRGRCLVFMIPDRDLVGRTDMKTDDGDLGAVIEKLSDTGFEKFFQRHAVPVSTSSGLDEFMGDSKEPNRISLATSDPTSRVEMLRRNGKFSVLKPREMPVECFVRHPDESNIWIAIVRSPLLPFAQ